MIGHHHTLTRRRERKDGGIEIKKKKATRDQPPLCPTHRLHH